VNGIEILAGMLLTQKATNQNALIIPIVVLVARRDQEGSIKAKKGGESR